MNGMSLVPTIELRHHEHKVYVLSEGGLLRHEAPLTQGSSFPYDLKTALQHEDIALVEKAVACGTATIVTSTDCTSTRNFKTVVQVRGEMHNLAGLPNLPM